MIVRWPSDIGHCIDNLIETKRELKMAKIQINDLTERLDAKEFDLCMLEFQWSVPEWRFDES